jgi:DNA-directed RNA polymerase sigma subunit (sigma70/sigma32)
MLALSGGLVCLQRLQAQAESNNALWQQQYPLATPEEKQKIQRNSLQQRQLVEQHVRNVNSLAEKYQVRPAPL